MKRLARKSKRMSPNRTEVINHAKVLRTFAKNNLTSLGRPRHELAHKTPLKCLTSQLCITLSSSRLESEEEKLSNFSGQPLRWVKAKFLELKHISKRGLVEGRKGPKVSPFLPPNLSSHDSPSTHA